MELAELEQLALSTDRAAALSGLLPGTPEHDYWRGILLQHEGRLDEVDELLRQWGGRHRGHDEHYRRLWQRQLLLRSRTDLARVADTILEQTGRALDDRAEVVVQAQHYPTRLDTGLLAENIVLRDAVRRRANLEDLNDETIPEIVRNSSLIPGFELVRRTILHRLQRVDVPNTLDLIVADLNDKDGSNGRFGALTIHTLLTLAQLERLAERIPHLRTQSTWVDAVLRRLAAPSWIDLRTDREERARLIDRALAFAQSLAPAFNTLKATLLYHRLDLDRVAGIFDRARFRAYVELPRNASWVPRALIQTYENDRLVQPNTAAAAALGLEAIGHDEPLVREYLSRFLLEDEPSAWSDVLDASLLAKLAATTRLLAGATGADAERATNVLDVGEREALKNRVDIDLAAQNPPWFGADDDVTLEVDVKNVRDLEVKVFRIDALAYWLSKNAEVDTSIDLDGMVPSGAERRLTFEHPPIRRHRLRLDLPECKRPGTYVVELIGNGRSSRALLRKGALRCLVRGTAAGLVVSVTDDDGNLLPNARLWLGGRELAPREGAGGIMVPFATSGSSVPVLLVHGDVVQRAILERPHESAALSAGFQVERESLVANQTARVLACPRLTIGGAPASLALLTNARVDISVTTLDGTSTSRSQPVTLADDEDLSLDLPIPEGTTRLSLSLTAQLRISSRQQNTDVTDSVSGALNLIHTSEATELMHLARVAGEEGGQAADSFVLSLLGKTGEPLAGRAVAFSLTHRSIRTSLQVTLETDENGAIDLGAIDGIITHLVATSPTGQTRSWDLSRVGDPPPGLVHALEGDAVVLPRTTRTRSIHDVTLMEHRRGANVAELTERVALVDRCVSIEGLAPGEYRLDYPGGSTYLVIAPRGAGVRTAPVAGAAAQTWARIRDLLCELSEPRPLLRQLAIEDDHLVVRVSSATQATRVHVIATRFLADRALEDGQAYAPPRAPQATRFNKNLASYVSGRDIGDEYRYVLERRNAPRRPGMMLEKPSLLLHPWALRSTETAVITAASGAAYGRPSPAAPAPAAAARMSMAQGYAAPEPLSREEPGFPSVDFLPASAAVLSNHELDESGVLRIPLASLGAHAQRVEVLVVDPSWPQPIPGEITLPATPLRSRDLRLRLALDPTKHFHEQRKIDGVPAGTTLVVPDVRTGKIELIGTLARAHQLLVTRMDDSSTLQEFAFVTEWPTTDEAKKRERYSKYACHELNLFLWRKDPAFFEAAIRPSLAHKREKSVVDRFLLGEDLTPFLESWTFGRLNTLERILVAWAMAQERASIARLVGDAVDLIAPDPEGDAKLVAALLGSAALEVGAGAMAEIAAPAEEEVLFNRMDDDTGAMEKPKLAKSEAGPMKKQKRRAKGGDDEYDARSVSLGSLSGGGGGLDQLLADMAERERGEAFFRGADKTQEWAEIQWWKRRREEIDATLIEPNRFWRDLAKHLVSADQAPFLSPHIGQCHRTFAEAMGALAFIDLPFVATAPDTTLEDTRFTLTAKSHALAASASLVELEAPADGMSSVLIGQSYVRSDDRWEWQEGEQREKRVLGELIAGVVYRCLVVVTNPTSATEKLDVLLQIPKGAIPVDSGFLTRSAPLSLDPYGTESFDYAFYFPLPGTFGHFPAHVTRNGVLVAHAPARELTVVREPSAIDHGSWSHVSQHGSLDDVLDFLDRANLGRTDLSRIAWRMHDAQAFERVTDLLAARHVYDDRLWAYALKHRNLRRATEWIRHQDDFLRPATRIDGFVDPTERAWYQHLEYAPLVNARAHRLGAQQAIPNSALDEQYRAFLNTTAHLAKPSDDDLLVAAHYLLAMDRVEDAIPLLQRISASAIVAKAQFDYLMAYVACYRGDVPTAKTLAARWLHHPIDRWRNRFLALSQMIDEIGQGARSGSSTEKPVAIDADSRDQKMAEAAARQPSLDIAVHGGDITLTHANLANCRLRFFKLDLELVFSRQPFVQSDVERFSFIEPGLVVDVSLGDGATTKVAIPASLKGANVVIEAVAPGLRRSVAHYAHDLGVQVAYAFGQLKVVRASTGAPLSSVYVKVYSRERSGGRVVFFKDGYTDLRGRFDYATLSTDDLDRTERFALLIASDDAGATITEASPPPR